MRWLHANDLRSQVSENAPAEKPTLVAEVDDAVRVEQGHRTSYGDVFVSYYVNVEATIQQFLYIHLLSGARRGSRRSHVRKLRWWSRIPSSSTIKRKSWHEVAAAA